MDDTQLASLGAWRVATDTDVEEMVLSARTQQRLGWIADWLSQPPHALKEWGVHHLLDSGFRTLFRGPSGTGKTMAAIALARGTERPLFRVDLESVVSEYMGETEKSLRQLFEWAQTEQAILLFDEINTLFGRRTDVSEANDRYANCDVAEFLQRIEGFQGLAILTSNANDKLDEAAVRRIDVIVDFPMPDAALRRAIWEKLLAALKLPRSDDIDIEALAQNHELCGGEILRCVRLAALLTTSAGKQLDMATLEFAAAERQAMHRPPQ